MASVAAQPALEVEIHALKAEGRVDAAATRAIEGYGPEVLGYLLRLMGDRTASEDSFAQFCEDVWRGMSGFRAESSCRTWCYRLAHHAACRHRRGAAGRGHVPLSDAPEVERLAQEVRTRTYSLLPTGGTDRLAAARAGLDRDDHALLMLRVDRDLSWSEVATALLEPEVSADAALVARRAAALRKRFERLKHELRSALAGSTHALAER